MASLRKFIFFVFIPMLFTQAVAAQAPFDRRELIDFIPQAQTFLDWCNANNRADIVKKISMDPDSVSQDDQAVKQLKAQGQNPERFAYILNHVILGGLAKDMMGDGEGFLRQLFLQRGKLLENTGISEADRRKELRVIDASIAELTKTRRNYRNIPISELELMWNERESLEAAMMEKVQIKRRMLPNRDIKGR